MLDQFEQGYALLIGVGESAYPKLSLPVTVKDTQSIYAALTDPELCAYPDNPQHIQILNNDQATRSGILDGLSWLQQQADPESTVLIYYSGHGWLGEADNSYYLLQHDIDPFDIAGSALSAEQFTQALRQIQSDRLLVVLDCCHAAGMATAKDSPVDTSIQLPKGFLAVSPTASKGLLASLSQGKGRAVFTSCRGEQKSWIKDANNSVYTYHFLEALQGADNQPGDRDVRISNLMHYLSQSVPETTHRLHNAEQTPRFDMDTEDFIIAKLQGGKGLPEQGWEAIQPQAAQKINQIAQTIEQHAETILNIQQSGNIHIGDVIGRP